MEHKSAQELRAIADVSASPPPPLDRRERLARWADLLEQDPTRRIHLVHELEFAPRATQGDMRADDSALSVAYADPLFRTLGLASDRVGDGQTFFGLSDAQTHRLLCSCMHGMTMRGVDAARLIRTIADPTPALVTRGLIVAAICAFPALVLMFG